MTSLKLRDLEVHQFGPLNRLRITGLSDGLNVICGPNGSGKSVLLEFLAGMWSGFGELSHRFTQDNRAAGTVTIETDAGTCTIRRRARPGHEDSLAIQTAQPDPFRPAFVKRTISNVDSQRLRLLHAVDAAALQRVPDLAELAAVSQPFTSRHSGTRSCPDDSRRRTKDASRREHSLLELEQRLSQRIEGRRKTLEARARHQATRRQRLESVIKRLESERSRLDGDLQSATTNMREWEQRPRKLEDPSGRDEQNPHSSRTLAAHPDLTRRIKTLQTVLADLAQDRWRLSIEISRSPLPERPALEARRERLDACERENLHQLAILLHQPHTAIRQPHIQHSGPPAIPRQFPDQRPHRLQAQIDYLQRRLHVVDRQLSSLWCQREAINRNQRQAAADDSLDHLRYSLSVVRQQISESVEQRDTQHLADVLVHQYRFSRSKQCLQRASRFFARLTENRYQSFRYDARRQSLNCQDRTGNTVPVEMFSRGTTEQAALALRLALLSAGARPRPALPAVWDEPLADSDESRLENAAGLLAEVAAQGTQIILFTCRENVAQILKQHGALLHRLDGRTPTGHQRTCRQATRESSATTSPQTATTPNPEATDANPNSDEHSEPPASAGASFRLHPAPRHWLDPVAPISELPSVGPQTARRLHLAGVKRIIDLIEFDRRADSPGLKEQQLDTRQILLWQAEARLACSVAGLTGRDAQMLVSCGILSAEELAAMSPDELIHRIDRLNGDAFSNPQPVHRTWPRRSTVENWIESARQPRPVTPPERDDDSPGNPPASTVQRHTAEPQAQPAFRLEPHSPVVDAPSIGEKTARLLERIGIVTVTDLLTCDVVHTADRLKLRRITPKALTAWQHQARLMCSIPNLRCADAQILVACGITHPGDLQRISPSTLTAIVDPFVNSTAGRRLLRSAKPPTPDDVRRWIETVELKRTRRAA